MRVFFVVSEFFWLILVLRKERIMKKRQKRQEKTK